MPTLNSQLTPALIIGANGMVGKRLTECVGDLFYTLTRDELDMADPEKVAPTLAGYNAKVILNAAAYTAVDKAESEEDIATKVNGGSVGKLAEYAFENDLILVHYSTDYVFDGSGNAPRNEEAPRAPLNAYGRSKQKGEEEIERIAHAYTEAGRHPKWIIFRTSWVFDESGKNFLNTMLRLGKERSELSVVSDQLGAPTYAKDLARFTIVALNKALTMEHFPSGIYHMAGSGMTSWKDFAETIFRTANMQVKVNPITTAEYPTPAQRPLNSRLDMHKLERVFGMHMPHWEDALKRAMETKGNI